jgi:hypothetical protein
VRLLVTKKMSEKATRKTTVDNDDENVSA